MLHRAVLLVALFVACAAVATASLLKDAPELHAPRVSARELTIDGEDPVDSAFFGSVDVSDSSDIFYIGWKAEKPQSDDPAEVPLVIWLTGGPGCSCAYTPRTGRALGPR